MMQKPNVSIIVPVYNVEKYLEECLKTLIFQTMHNIEIICVNDGSTDSSLEILEKYVKIDNRIKLISQKNSGQGVARNNAIKIAKGEYLGFVDPDDWVNTEMFEVLYNTAKLYDADLVEESFMINNEARNYIKKRKNKLHLPINTLFNYRIRKNYVFSVNLAVWNKLYRTNFIKKCNIQFMDIVRSEDIIFTVLSRALADKIVYIDNADYFYRIKSDNSVIVNTELAKQKNEDIFCFLSDIKNILSEHNVYENIKQEYNDWVISKLIDNYNKFVGNKYSYIAEVRSYLPIYQFLFFMIKIIFIEIVGNIFSVYNLVIDKKKYKIFKILGFKIKIPYNKIKI